MIVIPDLDHMRISLTDVHEVRGGCRGPGQVCGQRGIRDGFLDDLTGMLVRQPGLGRARITVEDDREGPYLVVLALQDLAQLRCAKEVLHRLDILGVLAQLVDQGAVGLFVGGSQPLLVGQDHQQHAA